jgi:PAS domain S-box-containing protein
MPEDAHFTPGDPGRELTCAEAEAILQRLAGEGTAAPGALRPPAGGSLYPAPDRAARARGDDAGRAEGASGPAAVYDHLGADDLRGLVEAVPDALVVVDDRGRIVLVNSQTEQLFGYRRDELFGCPVELLVPERFREQHRADRAAYIAAPCVKPMGIGRELYGRCKDGHEVPVEISLSPLHTDEGLLVVSSIRDVSDRRKHEWQLRKMEARYRALVEGIPAVTFMASLDAEAEERELYVSPQVEELLGFSQKEWLENPVLWHAQLHPEDRHRWHEEFARTCATAEPFRSVYRFISRDGRVVWVHGEAQVVRDDNGRPLFLQGVAFDITGIKQAEEELKALNQMLEQRVADRTQALEERAGELERSNKHLKEYADFVSHELKAPVSHVISFSQRLERECKGRLEPDAERTRATILSAGHRMSSLIQMMLKYGAVGKERKGFAATDCGGILAVARANLQTAIEECHAEVSADSLPTVWAVEGELVQVFENLVGNAIKYRGERPLRVHVGAQRRGDDWEFSVRDNGIGIDPDWLARKMFSIFEREHTRRKYEGSGIGLALCKKVIEYHGGRIWAESKLGEGSTIHFTLPAALPAAGG